MKSQHLGVLALVTTAVIWGLALPIMKVNLENIPPFTLSFSRFFIASVVAILFLNLANLKLKDFFHIAFFAFFGIALHIGLFINGLRLTSSIDAAFILAMSPVITSLLAVLTIREKISPLHILGILLSFCGIFLYLSYPYLFGDNEVKFNLLGDLLVLGAVLAGAVYIIGSKKLFETYPPSTISAVSFLVTTVSFFPLAVFEFNKNPEWVYSLSVFNVLSILFLGIFSSFVAYLALEWGLKRVAVHINETIGYLSVLISIYLATVFLKEELNKTFLLSSILVGAGIYLVTKFKPKNHPHYHHRTHKV
jgi:drug/metabolite transporter (DMT)-like permease